MSTKSTVFLTNDKNEEAFFDSNEVYNKKESLTLEFNMNNIRIDNNGDSYLILTITNTDSDLYKIFERLGEIVPKHLK